MEREYPPTLLLTALGDTRVDPMHALKMTARLQYNVAPLDEERPILLYTESKVGHGAGTSKERAIEIMVKSFTFRAHHIGMDISSE
ncbi:MAG: prolyl oligopeptidase family serine peptidase [Candidatus Thorarchaeota archaeon]